MVDNYFWDQKFVKTADIVVININGVAKAIDKYGNVIAESSDHAEVLQEAINKAPINGIIIGIGTFKLARSLVPRSNLYIKNLRVKLSPGVYRLFERDFGGSKGLENFIVEDIIVYGNKDVNESALIWLYDLAYCKNVHIRNIKTYDYYGFPAFIVLAPNACCGENIEVSNIVMYNAKSAIPVMQQRTTERFGVFKNVVVGPSFLWVDDDSYSTLYNTSLIGMLMGIDGLYIPLVVSRKASDGPTVRIQSCRNVSIGVIYEYDSHDYALAIVGGENIDVGTVAHVNPRNWSALILSIEYSTLGRLRNVVVRNVVAIGGKDGADVIIRNDANYDPKIMENILIENIYSESSRLPLSIGGDNGPIRNLRIGRIIAKSSSYTGINITGSSESNIVIDEYYAEDTGVNAPDNDHKAAILILANGKKSLVIHRMKAVKNTLDVMYGIRMLAYSSSTPNAEYRVIVDYMEESNLDGDITWYDEVGAVKRAIRRNKVYTSLPPTDIVGDKILYYDGTYYYIAVYNGSTWLKTQLS